MVKKLEARIEELEKSLMLALDTLLELEENTTPWETWNGIRHRIEGEIEGVKFALNMLLA